MSSTLVQFRCDGELKEKTTALYESLGLDLPSAFRLFMKRSLQVQGLPFAVNAKVPYIRPIEDMSGEEFDNMLAQGYQEALAGKGRPARDVFNDLERKYGL